MMKIFTQPNSLLRLYPRSIKWMAVTGLAVLLGNSSIAQQTGVPSGDAVKADSLNQTVRLLYGSQQKKFVTGAVSYLSGPDVSNVPGTNRLNSLSGRLTGLSVTQLSGLPSSEDNFYQIRGYHSFAGTGKPLVLINNRIDDVSEIEPNDIESITVLKDAAAVALYGLNSANGVILITTKRGQTGKIKINYNMESSFEQPTRLPKFLDSYNYATLYNEAQLNDNAAATPKYNATALQAYQTGSDPLLYPNNNWLDMALKSNSLQIRNNINISGGGDQVRYFVSGSYLTDNGIFKVDKSANTYNTNTDLNVFNVRGNVDIDVTKFFTLSADLRSKRETRNGPGAYTATYDQTLFNNLYSTPPNAYPVRNADGSLGGSVTYPSNIYGVLNNSGYFNYVSTSLTGSIGLAYNFDSAVKGLKLKVDFGFTNYDELSLTRSKTFAVYNLNTAVTPNVYVKTGADGVIVGSNAGGYTARQRLFDHFATLSYDREFGDHSVSAMLMYELQQYDNASINTLTQNFQGPKGRLSYRFKNRYLVDFVASYQGSEQFPTDNRYGFFPAVSAGWIVSEESFLKGSGVDLFKIRGSYGKTGNMPTGVFFDYLTSYTQAAGFGAYFGTAPSSASTGGYQNQIGNPLVTWESNLKTNLGLDLAFLHNRLSASIDLFKESTSGILVANAISATYGAKINTPSGTFDNRGFEVQATWADHIGNLQYSIGGNLSVAKNKIVFQNEAAQNYPWMYQTGLPAGTRMGYTFDRYFTEADIASGNYPNQSSLGVQRAGDLKYKDLNGDNVIDNNDISPIGSAKYPEVNFGGNLGLKYKAFDMNMLFQGTSHGTTYSNGPTTYEFFGNGRGSVVEHHLDRWTPNSGQSALYPRLTLTNTNNFVTSSFWVKDNSFVRLKYVEAGYTLPASLLKKIGVSSTRLFINGYNVLIWDKVKERDPEATDSGLTYPLQRSFSIGLNLKF
jgi:TonB-linked SusC/RagA family outer membrane protein